MPSTEPQAAKQMQSSITRPNLDLFLKIIFDTRLFFIPKYKPSYSQPELKNSVLKKLLLGWASFFILALKMGETFQINHPVYLIKITDLLRIYHKKRVCHHQKVRAMYLNTMQTFVLELIACWFVWLANGSDWQLEWCPWKWWLSTLHAEIIARFQLIIKWMSFA